MRPFSSSAAVNLLALAGAAVACCVLTRLIGRVPSLSEEVAQSGLSGAAGRPNPA
jgi:hypothetical protein